MTSNVAESDSKTSCCFPCFWRSPLDRILDITDPIMELPCKEGYAELCYPITTCVSEYEEIKQATKGFENCLFSTVGNRSPSMKLSSMTSLQASIIVVILNLPTYK